MRRTYLLLVIATVAGCGNNPYFSDDEGGPRPSPPLVGEHPDELSVPYALGTQVNIAVKQLSATEAMSFQLRSETPSVLRVDQVTVDSSDISAACTALSEGSAVIDVVDGQGNVQRSATVVVRAPDSARLYAHGPLRILGESGTALAPTEVSELRVLDGGVGVFAVAYFRGGARIYGRGLADLTAAPSVKAVRMTTSGDVTNEWVFVTPSMVGASSFSLAAGGVTLVTLPTVVVADADLATLTLDQEVGDLTDDKQQVWMLASASDGTGAAVSGVYASWTFDGAAQVSKDTPPETTGDLFRFEYNPKGTPKTLDATHGALHATAMIPAYDGWVANTTYLGCSVARGHGDPKVALALASLVALLIFRRRARLHSLRS